MVERGAWVVMEVLVLTTGQEEEMAAMAAMAVRAVMEVPVEMVAMQMRSAMAYHWRITAAAGMRPPIATPSPW